MRLTDIRSFRIILPCTDQDNIIVQGNPQPKAIAIGRRGVVKRANQILGCRIKKMCLPDILSLGIIAKFTDKNMIAIDRHAVTKIVPPVRW